MKAVILTVSTMLFFISSDAIATDNFLPVKMHHIEIQDNYIKERVFIGRVEAGRLSDLGFETGGNVSEIKVDEGSSVKKGDILATLDTDRLEAIRKEAVAALQRSAQHCHYLNLH